MSEHRRPGRRRALALLGGYLLVSAGTAAAALAGADRTMLVVLLPPLPTGDGASLFAPLVGSFEGTPGVPNPLPWRAPDWVLAIPERTWLLASASLLLTPVALAQRWYVLVSGVQLTDDLVVVVQHTMQLSQVSVWLRVDGARS